MSGGNGNVEVRLLSLPVDLWERASAHQESIRREFDILRGSLPEDALPHRLHVFVESLNLRFGDSTDPTWQPLYDASERGEETVDLVVQVPREVAGVAKEVGSMLDEVDEYCRAGDSLLTLATPSDQVEFREWFLGEFVRQIDQGLPPLSWESRRIQEPDSDTKAPEPDRIDSNDRGLVNFEGELDLVTAARLQHRIQAERSSGARELTLDLTGVTFIDSVGLSLLVTAHNRMSEEGGDLRLVLPKRLSTLFELSGLVELLTPEFVD